MSAPLLPDPVVLERSPVLTAELHRESLPIELAPLEALPHNAVAHLNASLNSAYSQALRIAWSRNGYLLRYTGDDRVSPAVRKAAQPVETITPATVSNVRRVVGEDFDPAAALRWCFEQILYVEYTLELDPTNGADLRVSTGRPASYRRHQLTGRGLKELAALAHADPSWPAKPNRSGGQGAGHTLNWSMYLGLLSEHWGIRHPASFRWRGLLTAPLLASPFWPFAPQPLPVRCPAEAVRHS